MGMPVEEEEEEKDEEKEDEKKTGNKAKASFGASRFVERMIRRMWHHREDVELNCEMLGCLEAMFKHSEETCRRVSWLPA